MARKIQFDVTPDPAAPAVARSEAAPDPSRAPALSGMARSLQAAAAAAIREIETRLIEDSEFQDRIDPEDEEIADLAESIRAQGQLIPILVSPLPRGRFRIVYGRRRLAALRRLGLTAKALVRDMDEDQAILAQGQENTFRRDLSWIEKAAFARQLLEAGKPDELVCDALNVDQKARRAGDKLTGLSRMRQVTARVSPALIQAIGPAPKVGRDRWYEAAQLLERKGFPPGNQGALIEEATAAARRGLDSDTRFQLLETRLRRPDPASLQPAPQPGSTALGQVKSGPGAVTITVAARLAPALYRWITDHPDEALQALHDAQKTFDQP